uniref:Uncharacterized protein n=1 Tax=Zosterops lateralis melanops TaxID=1220523 RepID=A0A8D2PVI3_ZOSLA
MVQPELREPRARCPFGLSPGAAAKLLLVRAQCPPSTSKAHWFPLGETNPGTAGISEQNLVLRLPSTNTLSWAGAPGLGNPNPKGQPQTEGLRAFLLHKNISPETGAVHGPGSSWPQKLSVDTLENALGNSECARDVGCGVLLLLPSSYGCELPGWEIGQELFLGMDIGAWSSLGQWEVTLGQWEGSLGQWERSLGQWKGSLGQWEGSLGQWEGSLPMAGVALGVPSNPNHSMVLWDPSVPDPLPWMFSLLTSTLGMSQSQT